jgi:hypothetical protein
MNTGSKRFFRFPANRRNEICPQLACFILHVSAFECISEEVKLNMRKVAAGTHAIPDFVQIIFQIRFKIFYGFIINSATARPFGGFTWMTSIGGPHSFSFSPYLGTPQNYLRDRKTH